MSAHTPGPWKVIETGGVVEVVSGDHDIRIATIDSDNCALESAMHDARLIAAAPDLLELVRDLLNAHEGAVNVSDDPFSDDLERSREWLERIHAAIAKAEGKS